MMRLLVLVAACWASTALATITPHHLNVFNKDNPTLPPEPPRLQKRASRWLSKKTQPFEVNGTGIPEVDFDVGESYAGLLPISDAKNETRKLFFWFFPSTLESDPEEIVIWLQGGPGCSALSGLLTENGPFTWDSGTLAPVKNPYSWTNLTNVIWIEQPIGVGYTQGTPDITNEVELGQQFIGFYKEFIKTFDAQNYKTYVVGESYGGQYVPYIADAFIQANDTEYLDLAGISLVDPMIGDQTIQQQVVAHPFVEYWDRLFYLNDTFKEQMQQQQDDCNYTDYYETYFKFPPPPGPFPVLPNPEESESGTCDMFVNYQNAITSINPCFNMYHITETCPQPFSQLGIVNRGDYEPPHAQVYFNRTDVQKALHAVVGTNWTQCTPHDVFDFGNTSTWDSDTSPRPAQNGVLQRVIEYTNNTMIGVGGLDFILPINGTIFTLQNMTWNGVQGFQKYPTTPLYVPYHPEYNRGALAGAGYQGVWVEERGLTFYTAQLAGHEMPGYTPGVGYRMLEVLLGRVQDLGVVGDFTTQEGNFTGNGTIF